MSLCQPRLLLFCHISPDKNSSSSLLCIEVFLLLRSSSSEILNNLWRNDENFSFAKTLLESWDRNERKMHFNLKGDWSRLRGYFVSFLSVEWKEKAFKLQFISEFVPNYAKMAQEWKIYSPSVDNEEVFKVVFRKKAVGTFRLQPRYAFSCIAIAIFLCTLKPWKILWIMFLLWNPIQSSMMCMFSVVVVSLVRTNVVEALKVTSHIMAL